MAGASHPRRRIPPDAGAAGNGVECDTWGDGGVSNAEVYDGGATADSPEQALDVARSEGLWRVAMEGLGVAKREQDRVLYVLEVDGVMKQALIVRDGPATEGAGGPGWYLESWARCDFAELPRSFTDSLGLQIWTDSAGNPVPTTKIESWTGPEHCDWESMTFLYLDRDEAAVFVRAPQPDIEEFFAEPYVEHAELPADAQDTGSPATATASGSPRTGSGRTSVRPTTWRSGHGPSDPWAVSD